MKNSGNSNTEFRVGGYYVVINDSGFNGRIGKLMDTAPKESGYLGLDFGEKVGELGHNLRGTIPEETGWYIPTEPLIPAKAHYLKRYKQLINEIS